MPRYNLNHQDVATLVSGLLHLALNSENVQEHRRITNLRDRLIYKLSVESENNNDQTEEDIDVWSVFSGEQ